MKNSVQDYIATQERHHQRKSFREELVEFLKKSEIEFEERYLD